LAESPEAAARQLISIHGGVRGLFVGWHANLMKDLPFVAVKLSIYESCVRAFETLAARQAGAGERTGCGVVSGALTAVLTTPLDVLNTRLKSSSDGSRSLAAIAAALIRNEGPGALLSGLAPRMAIVAGGSGVFWGTHSYLRDQLGLKSERCGDGH
jgi:solute carrier family 25 S-adenosylmethionine transporter 26